MKGDRVEALVDTGQGVQTFEIVATRAGRRHRGGAAGTDELAAGTDELTATRRSPLRCRT